MYLGTLRLGGELPPLPKSPRADLGISRESGASQGGQKLPLAMPETLFQVLAHQGFS